MLRDLIIPTFADRKINLLLCYAIIGEFRFSWTMSIFVSVLRPAP